MEEEVEMIEIWKTKGERHIIATERIAVILDGLVLQIGKGYGAEVRKLNKKEADYIKEKLT